MKYILLLLSILFVLFSFSPSIYELSQVENMPKNRVFTLDHNYLFDYNFYLSRIREGQENRWLVKEKYYNQAHQGSFFQIFYLLMGKIGGLVNLSPPVIYHLLRFSLGLTILILVSIYARSLFHGLWALVAFLLIVTSGSYPVLLKIGNFWRFGTYMGWWSAVDSLARITFLPHVLLGQLFILVFILRFCRESKSPWLLGLFGWGILGFAAGIIFPPTLIVIYTVFGVQTVLELILTRPHKELKLLIYNDWFQRQIIPRLVFIILSFPSFIYMQLMFTVMPWKSLALFDVEHRTALPYDQYVNALGIILPLGVLGLILSLAKKEKKLFPVISWIISILILFAVFERVPIQSPLRFTEGAINIPLGILAAHLFRFFWQSIGKFKRPVALIAQGVSGISIIMIILVGLGVMGSMFMWLKDQTDAKRTGGWTVPIGAQLAYPLKDFMDGVNYFRDNTKREDVVLSFITAGNYIPAYAGNFVYLGHANTPDEVRKENIVTKFFKGEMTIDEATNFLITEHISYIYFGPQERELGKVQDLISVYPFVSVVYENEQVRIYKFNTQIGDGR